MSEPISQNSTERADRETSAVLVKDLHKSYGSLEVLKGVSLDAHDGDVISIIGSVSYTHLTLPTNREV